MKKIILFITIVLMSSCTDERGAYDVLVKAGYKPIKVGGYGWFKGSDNDTYVTKFTAYSPANDSTIVTGVVCRGLLFKSSTIRID